MPPDLAQLSLARMSVSTSSTSRRARRFFHQGDLGDFVYVIQEGECDVLRTNRWPGQKLAELKTGDYFGEMAVLSDASRQCAEHFPERRTFAFNLSKSFLGINRRSSPCARGTVALRWHQTAQPSHE